MADAEAEEEAQGDGRELTVRAIVVGAFLALLLGAANMYTGMKVGLTVSASIPAAVMSMAILRAVPGASIQENNIAQTIASAAEALAAGVIFTVPALLGNFLGIWEEVQLWETFAIAATGGLLGVLFAVPLRKALIEDRELPFPEGVAAAAVLRAGHGGRGAKLLVAGAVAGGIFAFLQLGLEIVPSGAEVAGRLGQAIAFIGTDLSLILIGVGFLVGLRISSLIFAGGAFAWWIVLPALSALAGRGIVDVPATAQLAATDAAFVVWDAKIRLIGAGAMFTGGVLALWKLRESLADAFREGLGGFSSPGASSTGDMPMPVVLGGLALLLVPLALLVFGAVSGVLEGSTVTMVVLVAGFLLSAVAGYMAGVVGSSNNPVSGVTILALSTTAGLLTVMGVSGEEGILAALFVGAFIAVAAAISGDTMQDLKTGNMVGATPWKQQTVQLLGVALFAIAAPFVLVLLDGAFTIGDPETLPAPQAGLMASLLDAIFGAGVDLPMLGLGALSGLGVALAGLPVLPVAVGIYLPLGLSVPIFVGGLLRWGVNRHAERRGGDPEATQQRGTLLASGLIAGEAVAAILIAGLIFAQGEAGGWLFHVSPLALGLLVATGVLLVLGTRRSGWTLAAAAALAGAALTAWSALEGPPEGLAGGPLTGLLVMGYGALVVTYLAMRPALGTAPPDGSQPDAEER